MLTRSSFISRPGARRFLEGESTQRRVSGAEYARVLLKAEGEGPFLLQERARGENVEFPGQFSLFGGRRDGGETPEGAALRKLYDETGLQLEASQLKLIGRIESANEVGAPTSGHLFLADGLSFDMLQGLQIKNGKGVFLKRSEIGRHVGRLTSVALFALSSFEERDRASRLDAPPRSGFGGFQRK